MFQSLTEKLEGAFRRLRGKGKLTAADVKDGMREIKLALLEADVNFKVVRDFVARVSERAVGSEVLESLVPAQMIVKIVNEELISLLGGSVAKLQISPKPPTIVMMVGLQGAGKTTHAAKLAALYKKQGKSPLLVAADVYRPAAITQLQVVGRQIGVPVFTLGDKVSPVEICRRSIDEANRAGADMVFLDTAGRLQIDERLMQELSDIKDAVHPTEILLVVDAMTGQVALDVAKAFNERLDITGVVMTKMDGDTRGGAALSVKAVTGKPIKFIGTGEKLDAIEPFYPDRMASRILGMGDMLTLIERAERAVDEKKAAALEEKLRRQTFTLNEYLDQFDQIKKMGSPEQLAAMIPGVKPGALKDAQFDEREIDRMKAIILSMTPDERTHPDIIAASRKRRIAAGAGVSVEAVNRLLRGFDQVKTLVRQLTGGRGKALRRKGFRV